MAFSAHHLAYPQSHPPTASSAHPVFVEDNGAPDALDPFVLEADGIQSPFRKNSYVDNTHVGSGIRSSTDSHHKGDHTFSTHGNAQANPDHASFPDNHSGFMQHHAPHMAAYGRSSQHWAFDQSPGHGTSATNPAAEMIPAAGFDGVNPFQQQHHRADSAHGIFGQQTSGSQSFHLARPEAHFAQAAPQVQAPLSPHSHQDYMMMAQQEMENRPMSRRMRPNSPPTTTVDMARRDGIRKKNGRIDIPAERNINTIDALIEKATDEDEVKELKQQKRLLRNREAALASRQRKKKHTEDLEVKEKSFMHQINALEKQLADLHMDRQRREQEHMLLIQRCQEAERTNETLHEQMREMKYQHNEETSLLRKRVNYLNEQADAGPAPAMSAAPSSNLTDFNADMEALNMGGWDDFFFNNDAQDDFSLQQSRPAQTLNEKSSAATIVKKSAETRPDQPIASGLLFMLLLCGAFVASKQSAGSTAADVPNMPAEVRAAAPAVLNNLLSEAGSASFTGQQRHQPLGQESDPLTHTIPARGHSNRLEQQFHQLTSQTKQQAIDEAFSLSTAEHASLTNTDVPIYNDQAGSVQNEATRPRRTLADTLHEMQHSKRQSSKAELYTRSLLWDQIPADVVKQFKEMVRDRSQSDAITLNNSGGFKAEP